MDTVEYIVQYSCDGQVALVVVALRRIPDAEAFRSLKGKPGPAWVPDRQAGTGLLLLSFPVSMASTFTSTNEVIIFEQSCAAIYGKGTLFPTIMTIKL